MSDTPTTPSLSPSDVRQIEPGIHQDGVIVTSLNQLAEKSVLYRIGFHVMPARYLQSRHPRLSPPLCEIVGIGTNAVGGIEERP